MTMLSKRVAGKTVVEDGISQAGRLWKSQESVLIFSTSDGTALFLFSLIPS